MTKAERKVGQLLVMVITKHFTPTPSEAGEPVYAEVM